MKPGSLDCVLGKEEKMREQGKSIESVKRLGSPEGKDMKQNSQRKGTEKWT